MLDNYENDIEVGCIVAYNWGGQIAVGEVMRITPKGVIWINQRRPRPTSLFYHQKSSISKVRNVRSCLVLRRADGSLT